MLSALACSTISNAHHKLRNVLSRGNATQRLIAYDVRHLKKKENRVFIIKWANKKWRSFEIMNHTWQSCQDVREAWQSGECPNLPNWFRDFISFSLHCSFLVINKNLSPDMNGLEAVEVFGTISGDALQRQLVSIDCQVSNCCNHVCSISCYVHQLNEYCWIGLIQICKTTDRLWKFRNACERGKNCLESKFGSSTVCSHRDWSESLCHFQFIWLPRELLGWIKWPRRLWLQENAGCNRSPICRGFEWPAHLAAAAYFPKCRLQLRLRVAVGPTIFRGQWHGR